MQKNKNGETMLDNPRKKTDIFVAFFSAVTTEKYHSKHSVKFKNEIIKIKDCYKMIVFNYLHGNMFSSFH